MLRAVTPAASTGLAALLVGWSLVANLGLGDTGYLPRNLALTAVLLVVAMRAWGLSVQELGLARASLSRGAVWGGAAVVVVAVVLGLAVLLADHLSVVARLLADERAQLTSAELRHHVLLRIPLGTAVFEEVAFRGVLLAAWLRRRGTRHGVIGTSLVFGLWHVAPTMVALELNGVAVTSLTGLGAFVGAVVVTALAGVLFAGLRVASGSLLAPILAHWATNALGLLAAAWTVG